MSMFRRLFKGKKRDAVRKSAPEQKKSPAQSAPAAEKKGRAEPKSAPTEAPAEAPADTDTRTLEERCGITPDMDKAAMREQLAKLFRRYNRLASSLDGDARVEAEAMLDVIVSLRQKHLD